VVPEGLAAPYASAVGGGPRAVGLLLASAPAGALLGVLGFVRFVPARIRARLVPALAVACGLPLLACAVHPGLVTTLLLWALSGVLMSYQVQVMTRFVTATPAGNRGQVIAFASSGLLAVQGIGLLVGGLFTRIAGPATVVAGAGALACLLALLLGASYSAAARRTLR